MKTFIAWLCATAMTTAVMAQLGPGMHTTDLTTEDTVVPAAALQRLTNLHQGVRAWHGPDGRMKRVYGAPMGVGDTPLDAATTWIDSWSSMWNVDAADLMPGGVLPSDDIVLPLMVRADGEAKFHAVYFSQYHDGFPVFGGRLTMLSRNDVGHPIVMAAADLRDLGRFEATAPASHLVSDDRIDQLARALVSPAAQVIGTPRVVVFAGYDNDAAHPAMAIDFVAEAGGPADPDTHARWRLVVDPTTSTVLWEENQIVNCQGGGAIPALASALVSDVTGTVQAYTTGDTAAAACSNEILQPLPYHTVTAAGQSVFTDANGMFSHPHDGGVTSFGGVIDGLYFDVNNEAGSETSATASGQSGDDVTITYNPSPSEQVTAQVNAYLESNLIRDMVLAASPNFPVIANETNFPINVNLSSTCNAYYDYSSINFYSSGGSCNNTAFSVVVHHEYGHHGVACAGSGQGEYGEGMGDVWGVILTGDPKLARGFYASDCDNGIRNAENDCQYSSSCSSCGSAIHACGQLISGVVYDFMNNMGGFSNAAGMEVVRGVVVNSMPLHSGTSINADIAIDYLTLDDNDGSIDNGTPHWSQITAAFNDHGIETPELALLALTLPNGLPDVLPTSGQGHIMQLSIENLSGTYQSGSARMYHNQGGPWTQVSMDDAGGGIFEAAVPADACGSSTSFYFAATTQSGTDVMLPSGGQSDAYALQHADGPPIVAFEENFDTNDGWASSGSAADGLWDFGVPVNCNRGDPPSDFDGNNRCALTDNSSANSCNSDVDDGTAILESPDMDATISGAVVSYARWFSNDFGAEPYTDTFVVEASFNGGANWTTLETVGPDGPEVSGGWYEKSFVLESIAGYQPTENFRLRFTTSDASTSGSVVEAGVDAIAILAPDCDDEPACPGDITGDGIVSADDILAVLAGWGSADGDANGDGVTNVDDILLIVANFGCG
ncbi:MAG: hypothetical protein MK074_02665 [Phycisphaerales bacterium]|nr:hypothetical protein [Phycisphaerales bacterium]